MRFWQYKLHCTNLLVIIWILLLAIIIQRYPMTQSFNQRRMNSFVYNPSFISSKQPLADYHLWLAPLELQRSSVITLLIWRQGIVELFKLKFVFFYKPWILLKKFLIVLIAEPIDFQWFVNHFILVDYSAVFNAQQGLLYLESAAEMLKLVVQSLFKGKPFIFKTSRFWI